MSVAPFTVEFIVVFLSTLYVLHQYGNWRKQHWIVTVAVFVSWLFSFLIVFILPLDISSTYFKQCMYRHNSWLPPLPFNDTTNATTNFTTPTTNYTNPVKCLEPWSYMPNGFLLSMWKIVYWTSQLLSWLVLPMMQSYVYAGEFTIAGKIKTSLYENAIWYGSYLVIFGALLIYVAVKPELQLDGEHLKIIGITASNTWGLLLLVLLLGYGLVEVPRSAWNASLSGYSLTYAQFKISKLSTEKEDAEEELSSVLKEVKKASEEIKYNSNLRGFVDTIISKCPEASHSMFSRGTEDFVDYSEVAGRSQLVFNEKALVKLHSKVIVVTHRAHRTQVQWNAQLKRAFDLEDLDRNKSSSERIYKSSSPAADGVVTSIFRLRMKWFWKVWFSPILYKLLAITLILFSLCVVWSEVTFFSTDPNLSIFSVMLDSAKGDYLFFYIEAICCVTIAYMCACTYYTVFKMRIFNYYHFAPRHQTDANSLLFSSLLLCRLTVALCLNFLALIHLDGHVTKSKAVVLIDTSFTHIMGHMDVVSFVAKGFNVYYPMTVLLVCLCTYFHMGSRILHIIGFQQFLSDDELSADYVNEGKDILRRERRKAGRGVGSKEWEKRGADIRHKLRSAVRQDEEHDNARIDDDDSPQPQRYAQRSGRSKTKRDEDDRVQLLSAVDYAPDSDSSVTASGYSSLRGASGRGRPPKNFFDDI